MSLQNENRYTGKVQKTGKKNVMVNHCKGICNRFRFIGTGKGWYMAGAKRCSVCSEWLLHDGAFCPCCGVRLKTTPRHKQRIIIKTK